MRRLCWLVLPLIVGVSPAVAEGLPEPVARVAAALGVATDDLSVWVQPLGAEAPLAAHLPDQMRNPASVMKLVTSFAALQGLNPAYTWRTEVHALGPVENGVLRGDLLIRGSGDPFLVAEEFWKLVSGLRERGLRRIEGDLVFDVSRFQLPLEDPGRFDGRPDRVYNLVPHPLLVNFNAVRFEFQPGADGRSVRVSAVPELHNLQVANRLGLAPGACGGYQRGITLSVQEQTRQRVLLEGRFPSGCREYRLTRTVLQPESYAYALFKLYFRQLGGEFDGGWRWGQLPVPEGFAAALADRDSAAGALYVHHSRPLGELVRMVNKYSNNVMTRHLKLTLGAERFGWPATPENGRRAMLEILEANGVDTRGMIVANAAGLSREGRVSARQIAQLLQAAWDAPYMPEFMSSMALSGLDGTLVRRFNGQPSTGRMHLKTGSLNDVSAIAGYVQTARNGRLVVVLLVNSPEAHRGPGEELQDALLTWAFRQ